MAIASGGTMGTGVSAASSTTFTLTTATNTLADGNFALLTVVTDNTSTADADSSDHVSVSGGTGTWSKLGEYTNGNGAAAAGVTTSVWLFKATGTVSLGTVITITLGTAQVDKVASMWKYTKAAGTDVRLDPDAATNPINNGIDAANGFGSVAFSGLPSQSRLYYRGLGKEANSTTANTVSSGFTNITANRSRNNASAVLLRGEFRINTSTGETSNPTLAVSGDTAGVFVALEEFSPPQTLTQGTRFDNTETFYSPTVTQPAASQNLTVPLYTNTQVFNTHTVTATRALTAARYDNTQTFYAHTVTPGAVTLTPVRYDNGQTFYAATISQTGGVQNLLPNLYTNTQTFYGPTVTSVRALTASRIDNTNVVYSATVSSSNALTVPRYDNTNTFYAAVVSSVVNLGPGLFTNTNDFYSPTVDLIGGSQFITFPDWVDPGHVEPGWVEWPYFNQNQFFDVQVSFDQFLFPSLLTDGGATGDLPYVLKYYTGSEWLILYKDPTVYS